MNLHPDMTRQLAADRQDELRRRADRARLVAAARGGPGRSRLVFRLVARLVGWWHADAFRAPADLADTACAEPVIDLTDDGELMVTLRYMHERTDALAGAAAQRY